MTRRPDAPRAPRRSTIHQRVTAVLAGSLDVPALLQLPDLGRAAYWSSRRPAFRRTVPRVLADLLAFRTPRPGRVLNADELAAVTAPTLVAWGRRDRFATVENARAAVTRMPDATFHVVDGGHVPWLTDPAGVADLIQSPDVTTSNGGAPCRRPPDLTRLPP